MHVGAAAVSRVHAALGVKSLERGAERGNVVFVQTAAIHCVDHGWCAVVGGAGVVVMGGWACVWRGEADSRPGLRWFHYGLGRGSAGAWGEAKYPCDVGVGQDLANGVVGA